MRIKIIIILLFYSFTSKSTLQKYFSYAHRLLYGPLPVFELSKFVNNTSEDVPEVIAYTIKFLTDNSACEKSLFELKGSTVEEEDIYRAFIHSHNLPNFKSTAQAGRFLMILLDELDFFLLSKEIMEKINDANFEIYERLGKVSKLSYFLPIFQSPFKGKAMLGSLLLFFSKLSKEGCIPGTFHELASLVSRYLAEKFADCSWMFKCDEYSRSAIVSSLFALGEKELEEIFKTKVILSKPALPSEETSRVVYLSSGQQTPNLHNGPQPVILANPIQANVYPYPMWSYQVINGQGQWVPVQYPNVPQYQYSNQPYSGSYASTHYRRELTDSQNFLS